MAHKTAQQLNLPEEFVLDLVEFYYKEIRRRMLTLEEVRINVHGLCYFDIKFWKIDDQIIKYKRILEIAKKLPKGPKKKEMLRGAKLKLYQLKQAKKRCEVEQEKKMIIKQKRKKIIDELESNLHLEKEGQNNRGN